MKIIKFIIIYFQCIKLETVNISEMSFKEGKTQLTGAISVNEEDIESFKKLNEKI